MHVADVDVLTAMDAEKVLDWFHYYAVKGQHAQHEQNVADVKQRAAEKRAEMGL